MKNTQETNEQLFAKFKDFALTPEEARMVKGGGQFLNQAIIQQLCEKQGYEIPLNEWQHADYRYWAHCLGVSINTIKRWLNEGKNPQKEAQITILGYLQQTSWNDLEQHITLKNTQKTK